MAGETWVHGLIAELGGPVKVLQALNKLSYAPITLKAIEKWRERGHIPAGRLLELQMVAEALGKKVNVREHYVRGQTARGKHEGSTQSRGQGAGERHSRVAAAPR